MKRYNVRIQLQFLVEAEDANTAWLTVQKGVTLDPQLNVIAHGGSTGPTWHTLRRIVEEGGQFPTRRLHYE